VTKAFEALLKKKATFWASDLTKRVKANAPKHIAPYVSSKSHQTGYGYSIVTEVKQVEKVSETGAISNYGSTDARAQEYGHPGAVITPRAGRKYLAFPWQVQVVGAPRLPNGDILLKSVKKKPQKAYNSGKGYIRLSMRQWETNLIEKESFEIADAISIDIRNGFKTSGKVKWVSK
jgi:hypothetical protein